MRALTPRALPESGLADALADVAAVGERLVAKRLELFRVEARDDASRLLMALACAVAAALAGLGTVTLGALASALALRPWVPMPLTLLAFATLLAAIGVWIWRNAQSRLRLAAPGSHRSGKV